MSTPKWTVVLVDKNMGTDRDTTRKCTQEFHLKFEGFTAHILTGERGRIILEEFCADLNAKGYEPTFEKGKMICDLSQSARTKLALMQSPALPFDE